MGAWRMGNVYWVHQVRKGRENGRAVRGDAVLSTTWKVSEALTTAKQLFERYSLFSQKTSLIKKKPFTRPPTYPKILRALVTVSKTF